ncbi:MAG: DUF1353 domain-containing protein [Gammaproteobacteria bacterium]|nr:DUF1353 domain-containing protein [Gammaproteobacteria bacterium]
MRFIKYRGGYKYQLAEDFFCETYFIGKRIETTFIVLTTDGSLIIRNGYAWDGPSGPTIDTPNFMRGSLVHDVLYQLMRNGHLEQSKRKLADKAMKQICLEDGMSRLRAQWVYLGVRLGGESAASRSSVKKVFTAPKPPKP